MNKTELQNIHKILTDCLYNFRIAYRDYKDGRNAKIRKDGERRMDNEIVLAKDWIYRNRKVYEIASGGENRSDFHRAMYIEETFWIRYFARDVEEILRKLKELISSLE